jgi:hypothetical protein
MTDISDGGAKIPPLPLMLRGVFRAAIRTIAL